MIFRCFSLLAALLLASFGALAAAVGEVQSDQPDVLLTNRKAWEALAARGNPLLLLNAERFRNPQPPFKPPEKVPNTWTYRVIAEQLVPAAYAATAQQSPHRGRADLVAHCVAVIDWLTQQCDANGLWYRREGIGDPNVNRFTLGPLLDAVHMLQTLPAGREAWPRWKDKLDRALDHQRRAFRGEFDWEWVHPEVKYPNHDLYGPLCFWLSAELYGRDEDRQLAQHILRKTTENLLPDGGLHYIGIENESPVYHALNLILIARYATLSRDPVAVKLLQDMANYWPLVLTAEGYPECWSDVWWKQTWGPVWREALVVAAGATGEPRNQWLLWRVLERSAPSDAGMGGIYAAPYWTGVEPGEALPDLFVVRDENIRGVRGRAGSWYFGVCRGRGLRNTFVGGLVTSPTQANPLLAALRGAGVDVLLDAERPNGLWLSEVADRAAVALRPEVAAGLGVRYTLQRSLINGWPTPQTSPSPWQVTQVWRAAGDGIVGLVAVEATADAPAAAVLGRIALGPGAVEAPIGPDAAWRCGPLAVKFFDTFGTASVETVPQYARAPETWWPGVQLRQNLDGGAKSGQRFVYSVWIGPQDAEPPVSMRLLPQDRGWLATWPGGRQAAAVFNPTAAPLIIEVPWSAAAARQWSQDGTSQPLPITGGHVTVSLPPDHCVLLEE
ncbi:MAG: hypothetical protein KJ000_32765 [Pirellulaceae bacterium]|nr:hypothetical protein [Pirellulaceae bacterium]